MADVSNTDIDRICRDLYDGSNFIDAWPEWAISADFHEHAEFVWKYIQQYLLKDDPRKKLNIVETGRCMGQSTVLFSAIAKKTDGYFYSFDPQDSNREMILRLNQKYGIPPQYYCYVVDLSFNATRHIPKDFKIDVLFLDSLHTYDCVKQETLTFEKHLSERSIVFFHDTVWCFDSVMGWIKDYLSDKEVAYVKHPHTHRPQCEHCERLWGKPGRSHGRPHMIGSRPDFQSLDEVKTSPYFEKLQYDFIPWIDEDFEKSLAERPMVFTNIEACCGIGALFINRSASLGS